MKAVFVLFVLACTMSVVYGDLICGRSYCAQNPCITSVARSSCRKPSEYREKHGGRCGCCPACVTLLDEGAACKTYDLEHGQTPSAVCREPLKCLIGVCTKVTPRNNA